MTLATERPADEVDPVAALSAFLTARIGSQRYTVQNLQARLLGGTVVVDVQFRDGETATLRIARAKAAWLIDELVDVLAR